MPVAFRGVKGFKQMLALCLRLIPLPVVDDIKVRQAIECQMSGLHAQGGVAGTLATVAQAIHHEIADYLM